MIYCSIDIETTGLDSDLNQMIEFAAIIEDSNNPKSYEDSKKYRRIILAQERMYNFSSYAAKINAGLMSIIADIENGKAVTFENNSNLTQLAFTGDFLIPDFKIWLLANGFKENINGVIEIVPAGKNFASFDKRFIEKVSDLTLEAQGIKFAHRALDPTLAYVDWTNDKTPPSTETCKKRGNFIDSTVAHNALADAWDVICLLRQQYNSGYREVKVTS